MQLNKLIFVILGFSGCVTSQPFVTPENHPANLNLTEEPAWSGPSALLNSPIEDNSKSDESETPVSSGHHHMHGGN